MGIDNEAGTTCLTRPVGSRDTQSLYSRAQLVVLGCKVARQKSVEDDVNCLVARVQHVWLVPIHEDGRAHCPRVVQATLRNAAVQPLSPFRVTMRRDLLPQLAYNLLVSMSFKVFAMFGLCC